MKLPAFLAVFSVLMMSAARADDAAWVSLYNGKDLKNWVNVNCAPKRGPHRAT